MRNNTCAYVIVLIRMLVSYYSIILSFLVSADWLPIRYSKRACAVCPQQERHRWADYLAGFSTVRRSAVAAVATLPLVTNVAHAEQVCPEMTDQQLIDSAVEDLVEKAMEFQRVIDLGQCPQVYYRNDRPCVNFIPYFSPAEFYKKNPNCCTVVRILPGDYPDESREHIPKIILVKMKFYIKYADEFSKIGERKTSHHAFVTCRS